MKKLISIIMIAAVCAAFTACENTSNNSNNSSGQQSSTISADNDKTIREKAEELLNSLKKLNSDKIKSPDMAEPGMDYIEAALGITPDMVTDFVFYVSAGFPDEFGIFVASSESAANEIKSKLSDEIERQRELFATYNPDEAYKLTGCFCEADGNTVIFAICADNSKAREILK